MLNVSGIDVHYGQSQVLRSVSLQVNPGEIVCLIGRNGVGKSTTLKAIMGLVPLSKGQVSFKNRKISGAPPHQVVKAGVGYVPEDRRVFGPLTVLQNLEVAARSARSELRPWTLAEIYDVFPVLGERSAQLAGSLSGGEQQMLTTARALMGNPELVLIDEPNEGLAPMFVERMNQMISEVSRRGAAILLVEQSLASALSLAHRVYVMSKGEIVFEGTGDDLSQHPDVRRRYLEL